MADYRPHPTQYSNYLKFKPKLDQYRKYSSNYSEYWVSSSPSKAFLDNKNKKRYSSITEYSSQYDDSDEEEVNRNHYYKKFNIARQHRGDFLQTSQWNRRRTDHYDDRLSKEDFMSSTASCSRSVEDPTDECSDATMISVGSSCSEDFIDDESISSVASSSRSVLRKCPRPTQAGTRYAKTYSIDLEESLRSDDWMNNLKPYIELEKKAKKEFERHDKEWREGYEKKSFTYLLLDPRKTRNLPDRKDRLGRRQTWLTFIKSIFYVGKGQRSRPYSHLKQALNLWESNVKTSDSEKEQYILDIWSKRLGVLCLIVFQSVIPAEAYTYEACMIDAIGKHKLKNEKVGDYYGVVCNWPEKKRRMLGLYLLYKAMNIFLLEGERQIKPEDLSY